jgi:hypothetical protein
MSAPRVRKGADTEYRTKTRTGCCACKYEVSRHEMYPQTDECRETHIKCDERKPTCQNCQKRGFTCEYALSRKGNSESGIYRFLKGPVTKCFDIIQLKQHMKSYLDGIGSVYPIFTPCELTEMENSIQVFTQERRDSRTVTTLLILELGRLSSLKEPSSPSQYIELAKEINIPHNTLGSIRVNILFSLYYGIIWFYKESNNHLALAIEGLRVLLSTKPLPKPVADSYPLSQEQNELCFAIWTCVSIKRYVGFCGHYNEKLIVK